MAVMVRNVSALKEERTQANKLYHPEIKKIDTPKEEFVAQLHDALFFATIVSYSQGMALLSKASAELKMDIPLPEVIRVWTGGCIIRSGLLNLFGNAFAKNPQMQNLLLDENIATAISAKLKSLRNVVITAISNDYPVNGLSACLNYFNAYCREKLPTNLIQAQRDYFGSHTYERIDLAGIFHTDWEHDAKTVDHSSNH
jgi:6-phosphogluconate dehydrogenase